MRRLASRSARVAAFFADVLLIALAPSMFFYPAYHYLVPAEPKAPLLPVELLTEIERSTYEALLRAHDGGLNLLCLYTAALFFFAFMIYQTSSLLQKRGADSARGQTFGMSAVATRVVRHKTITTRTDDLLTTGAPIIRVTQQELPVSLWAALLRGFFCAISAALFLLGVVLVGNLLFLLLTGSASVDNEQLLLMAGISASLFAVQAISLIPRRSLVDFLSGTYQIALYGDLFEEERG